MLRIIQFTLCWLRSLLYLICCLIFLFTYFRDNLKLAILDHQMNQIWGDLYIICVTDSILQRWTQQYLPLHMLLQCDLETPCLEGQERAYVPSPWTCADLCDCLDLVEYGEGDTVWFLKQNHKYTMYFCLAFLGCLLLEFNTMLVGSPNSQNPYRKSTVEFPADSPIEVSANSHYQLTAIWVKGFQMIEPSFSQVLTAFKPFQLGPQPWRSSSLTHCSCLTADLELNGSFLLSFGGDLLYNNTCRSTLGCQARK